MRLIPLKGVFTGFLEDGRCISSCLGQESRALRSRRNLKTLEHLNVWAYLPLGLLMCIKYSEECETQDETSVAHLRRPAWVKSPKEELGKHELTRVSLCDFPVPWLPETHRPWGGCVLSLPHHPDVSPSPSAVIDLPVSFRFLPRTSPRLWCRPPVRTAPVPLSRVASPPAQTPATPALGPHFSPCRFMATPAASALVSLLPNSLFSVVWDAWKQNTTTKNKQ